MSIGLCVTYRDPSHEEEYWPYLTQPYLTECLWPLALSLGLERVELLEVLMDYDSAENVRELLNELHAVVGYLSGPAPEKEHYPRWEHVLNRTVELTLRLQQVLAEWSQIREVSFF